MGKTSAEVKNRYRAKAYVQWNIVLKPEMAEEMDRERGEMSKNEFIRMLYEQYMKRKRDN